MIIEIQMVYIGTMNFIQKNQSKSVPWTAKDQWSGSVPTISGSVLDWLQSMVAHFGGKKPD